MQELKKVSGMTGLRAFLSNKIALRSFFVLMLVLSVFWSPWRISSQGTPRAHASGGTPIKHIVFLIKENHSFDNYFGRFPGAHGTTTGKVKVNGVDQTINLAPIADQALNYCHVRKCFLTDFDRGATDHFNNGFCTNAPYTCYQAATQDQIPNYWNLASNYVLSDETYASMGGPSYPNHQYTIAAGSGDTINTTAISDPTYIKSGHKIKTGGWGCDSIPQATVNLDNGTKVFPCFDYSTLADLMDQAGVSWKYYAPGRGEGGYIWNAFDAIKHIREGADWTSHIAPWQNFVTDAQAGNLPAFSWLIAPSNMSEHPVASTCVGENWTVQQINAVMQGSDWSSTAIFLAWDDWGGFYDHEPPIAVDAVGYGFRVPMIIISPFAHTTNSANAHITHTTYDFSSVLAFAENVFNLPNLGRRDTTANNMMDAFNFSQVWNGTDILNTRVCTNLKPYSLADADTD